MQSKHSLTLKIDDFTRISSQVFLIRNNQPADTMEKSTKNCHFQISIMKTNVRGRNRRYAKRKRNIQMECNKLVIAIKMLFMKYGRRNWSQVCYIFETFAQPTIGSNSPEAGSRTRRKSSRWKKKQKRNQYLKQPIVQLVMQPAHLFRQYRSYRFAQRRNSQFAVSVAGHAS